MPHWIFVGNLGVVGPALIGSLEGYSGGYALPMLVLAALSGLATLYFSVLLQFLPVKHFGTSFAKHAILHGLQFVKPICECKCVSF